MENKLMANFSPQLLWLGEYVAIDLMYNYRIILKAVFTFEYEII